MNEFNPDITVCKTKVRHDTEWEATRAAAIMQHRHNEEFEAYACGNHYHVTHTSPELRRGVGHKYKRCPHCKNIYTPKQMAQHKCPIRKALGYDSPLGF